MTHSVPTNMLPLRQLVHTSTTPKSTDLGLVSKVSDFSTAALIVITCNTKSTNMSPWTSPRLETKAGVAASKMGLGIKNATDFRRENTVQTGNFRLCLVDSGKTLHEKHIPDADCKTIVWAPQIICSALLERVASACLPQISHMSHFLQFLLQACTITYNKDSRKRTQHSLPNHKIT